MHTHGQTHIHTSTLSVSHSLAISVSLPLSRAMSLALFLLPHVPTVPAPIACPSSSFLLFLLFKSLSHIFTLTHSHRNYLMPKSEFESSDTTIVIFIQFFETLLLCWSVARIHIHYPRRHKAQIQTVTDTRHSLNLSLSHTHTHAEKNTYGRHVCTSIKTCEQTAHAKHRQRALLTILSLVHSLQKTTIINRQKAHKRPDHAKTHIRLDTHIHTHTHTPTHQVINILRFLTYSHAQAHL